MNLDTIRLEELPEGEIHSRYTVVSPGVVAFQVLCADGLWRTVIDPKD